MEIIWQRLKKILLEQSTNPDVLAGNFESVLARILDALCLGLKIRSASYWRFDATEQQWFGQVRLLSQQGCQLQPLVCELDMPLSCALYKQSQKQRCYALNSELLVTEYTSLQQYCAAAEIASVLISFVLYQGAPVGMLWIEQSQTETEWIPLEQAFAINLSDVLARCHFAMVSKQAFSELQSQYLTLQQQFQQQQAVLADIRDSLAVSRDQLSEAEKMSLLGQMVAGVTHEVNTPLGIAITASTHLSEEVHSIAEAAQHNQLTATMFSHFIEQCQDGMTLLSGNLQRAADLVRDFKQTAVNRSNDVLSSFDLQQLISSSLHCLLPMTKKRHIGFTVEVPTGLKILSYPGSLSQIMTNLVMNSFLHGFESQQNDDCHIHISVEALRECVQIVYRDNGNGMQNETLQHLYEPYYTTKRGNGGTGLGLAIVHTLVTQKLQGQIVCESKPGEFTQFTISLPKMLTDADQEPAEQLYS